MNLGGARAVGVRRTFMTCGAYTHEEAEIFPEGQEMDTVLRADAMQLRGV